MAAGTTTPPAAANTGSEAARHVRNCPSTISRLISSPTSRKKIGISNSFTHSTSEWSSAKPQRPVSAMLRRVS